MDEQELKDMQPEQNDDIEKPSYNYLRKQKEKIDRTKEKLNILREKIGKKGKNGEKPRDTIARKLLMLRFSRLKYIVKRMEAKHAIDKEEDSLYTEEVNRIKKEIRELEETKILIIDYKLPLLELEMQQEKEKQKIIENYTRRLKGSSKVRMLASRQKEEVNSTEKRTVKSTISSTKQQGEGENKELEEETLEEKYQKELIVLARAEKRLKEAKEKLEEYKKTENANYKEKLSTKMKELKKEEKEEVLALTKQSIWTKMKSGLRTLRERFVTWNQSRKEESTKRTLYKESIVMAGVEELLKEQPTKRETFVADLRHEGDANNLEQPIEHTVEPNVNDVETEKTEESEPRTELCERYINAYYERKKEQGNFNWRAFWSLIEEEANAKGEYTKEQLELTFRQIEEFHDSISSQKQEVETDGQQIGE